MENNLIKTLHEWWASTAALSALVPVERVGSEMIQDNEEDEDDEDDDDYFDDCVVIQVQTESQYKTNSGRGWRSTVKISCFSVDQDRSGAIGKQLATSWNDASFTGSEAKVTLSTFRDSQTTQDDTTGVWERLLTFDMNHKGL